jgi:S-adenosyl methyltransferase
MHSLRAVRSRNPREERSLMAAFDSGDPDSGGLPTEIDMSRPHPSRIYDYLLGRCFL